MASEHVKLDSIPVNKAIKDMKSARTNGVLGRYLLVRSQMLTATNRLSTCWDGPAKAQFDAEFAQLLEDAYVFLKDVHTWSNGVSEAMKEYAKGDMEIADQVANLP